MYQVSNGRAFSTALLRLFLQLPCNLEYSSPPTFSTALLRPLDERGAQGAESQYLKPDACLPRHACIQSKMLRLNGLQNALLALIVVLNAETIEPI